MVFAMAGFALEDTFIKSASETLPVGEILIIFGTAGTLILVLLALLKGEAIWTFEAMSKPLIIRAVCEIMGRTFYTLALALTPLTSVSAILQATPLVVVLGASIFFKEKVGAVRWLAIMIGFMGVLMILRPGSDAFQLESIFAVLGTLGFAGRDLATRAASSTLTNMQLNIYGLFILIPTGMILVPFTGGFIQPTFSAALSLTGTIAFGVIAYYALTVAMRTGEVSIVTPFRYTRLAFAFAIGIVFFAERPDHFTLMGIMLIVVSGLFSLFRSRSVASKPEAALG